MFTYTQQKYISEMNLHSHQLGPFPIFFRTQNVPFRSGNGLYKNNYKVTQTQETPFCNARYVKRKEFTIFENCCIQYD